MHYIEVLYDNPDHDTVITFLKAEFKDHLNDVNVETLSNNEYIRIEWEGIAEASTIALKMTESIPSVLIETESNNGLETNSRYFNGTQLW